MYERPERTLEMQIHFYENTLLKKKWLLPVPVQTPGKLASYFDTGFSKILNELTYMPTFYV
jgi:hypothetical protein